MILGFPNLTNFGFAVVPRYLNRQGLFAIQRRTMGRAKNDNLAGISASISAKSEKDFPKENGVANKLAELLSVNNDHAKLESMTVQQLRTALKTVGVSSKGRKPELISSVRAILDNGIDGKSSLVSETQYLNGNSMKTEEEENCRVQKSVQISTAVNVIETSKQQQGKRKGKNDADEKGEGKNDMKPVKQSNKRSVKRKVVAEAASLHVEVSKGVDESVYEKEPWTRFAHKKPQSDWVAYNPKTMRPPPLKRDTNFVKMLSWNVNGLRALLKLEGFSALQLAEREDFDILCLQETKLQEKDVKTVKDLLQGYENSFWTCSAGKPGYSGTAIVSRIKPLNVQYGIGISDHDTEGRLVTAEFESFYLLCVYVPNSGDGLKRLDYRVNEWDKSLCNYMKVLEKSKPVILTGDLNCAHREIDIYNPAGNKRSAGFTIEERESFETNFLSNGFVDTFRKQHPNVVGYTYWGYRHGGRKTNRGWRLDYFLVSSSIANNVHDSYILPDVLGSDHCPIGLVLKQ